MLRAEFFYTYVKALIFCEVPKPESGSVPGSSNYQYNSIRKFIYGVMLLKIVVSKFVNKRGITFV